MFIQHHWRMFVLLAGLGVVYLLGNRVVNYLDTVAHLKNDEAQKTLQDQITKNDEQKKALDELVKTLTAQNISLAAAISSRDSAVRRQQTVDISLPLPDLGARWGNLLRLRPADIQPSGTGLVVSSDASYKTVQQLELVPALTADLSDQKTVTDNQTKEITGLNTRIDGLNLQIKDAGTACDTKIAVLKADSRKAKSKWFKVGFVGGFITGVIVGHKL